MRGISLSFLPITVCALTGLTGLNSTTALAITPGVHAFEAHLEDAPCGNNTFYTFTFCGSGKLTGFGTVKTRLALRAFVAPAAGCVGGVGTRTLTLASDRKNTLRLAVKGAACGSRRWGTFKVYSGSGVFAGATGSGVILGSFTKTGHEHLRYSGVLTLARK
jgi:hypothetical protein